MFVCVLYIVNIVIEFGICNVEFLRLSTGSYALYYCCSLQQHACVSCINVFKKIYLYIIYFLKKFASLYRRGRAMFSLPTSYTMARFITLFSEPDIFFFFRCF